MHDKKAIVRLLMIERPEYMVTLISAIWKLGWIRQSPFCAVRNLKIFFTVLLVQPSTYYIIFMRAVDNQYMIEFYTPNPAK